MEARNEFIHITLTSTLLIFLAQIQGAACYTRSQYSVGCYPYNENHTFYYQAPTSAATIHIDSCRTDCTNYPYAAMWLGKICSCLMEIETTENTGGACNQACDGNGNEVCGNNPTSSTAPGYMSIYTSKSNDEKNPTNITIVHSATGSTNPWNQTVPGTAEVIINGQYSEDPTPTFKIEVSDGTDRPLDEAVYDANTNAHTFTMFFSDHQYEVVGTATMYDGTPLTSALTLQTNSRLVDVELTCPRYQMSTAEFECQLVATGSKMAVTVDFDDGTPLRNLDLGDNVVYTLGSLDDKGMTLHRAIDANYLYFMPERMIKHRGYHTGVRFNALESNVNVKFQIWRPQCTTVNEVYCHHNLQCVGENSTCSGINSTLTTQCATGNTWSFSERSCVDASGNIVNTNQIDDSELGADRYEMVHEYTVLVPQTGWQSHHDDSMFQVLPGDVIGINQAGNCISYIQHSHSEKAYSKHFSGYLELGYGTERLFTFMLETYIARSTEVVLKKTYPDSVDDANVTVSMTSVEDPDVTKTDFSYVDVQVAINGVELVTTYSVDCIYADSGGTTNYTHYFNIPDHLGELPFYRIDWGDDSPLLFTYSSDTNHTYITSGVYNVTVIASNAISNQFALTTVAIQDEILNLTLDKDYFITALDNQSQLFINIDQGTNVTYTITVYDRTGTEFVLLHDDDNALVPGEHNGYSAYLNYTFREPGNWTMKVVAENCISRLEASLWFKVEIPIVGLDIIEIPPVAYGNSTLVYFSIVNGTDITFYSNFDGKPTREWVMHEAGIIGHQYDDVAVLKVTLIYSLMRDWINEGRVGAPPITIAEAEEYGLGSLVSELNALGQSSLEMLAGPMNPLINIDGVTEPPPPTTAGMLAVNGSGNGTAAPTTADPNEVYELELLNQLHDSALSQLEKAKSRCARDVDGCSWHHGMAYVTPIDYNCTGPHTLELFAENTVQESFVNVSTTIWVEYIIEDLVLLANETFVKPGDMVLFNMTVSQLSRANTTIYYDDGHIDEEYRYEMLENDSIEFMHVWNVSGNYSVIVESINNVSTNLDVVNMTVQDPVKAMYLRTNSPVTRPWERGGFLEIEIYWAPGEALLATDPFIWIDWGRGPELISDEFLGFDDYLHNVTIGENQTIYEEYEWLMGLVDNQAVEVQEVAGSESSYNIMGYRSLSRLDYWDFGDYNISVNVSNLVSWKVWEMVIVVDQDVLDLDIQSAGDYNVTYGDFVEFPVKRRWGSRVNLTWDYKDGTPNEWDMYKPDMENVLIHQYNEVGVFWTTVTAVNSVGTWQAMIPYPIIVQHPITGFYFNCTHEQVLLESPGWNTYVESVLWLHKDTPWPTNVTVIFTMDVGNSTNVTRELNDLWDTRDPNLDTSDYYHIHTIGYDYGYGGLREMTAEMYNLISDGTYGDKLEIYEDIHNMTLSVRSVKVPEDAELPSLRLDGWGPNKDRFPLDHYMVVEVDMYRGSFVHYNWTFGDGTAAYIFDQDYIVHLYSEVDWYTVSVYAYNELSNATYDIRFQMQRGVGPVSVWSVSPVSRNRTIDLTIDPGWIGTDACYMVDAGERQLDDGEELPEYPVYMFGHEGFCAAKFAAISAEHPDMRTDYHFDQAGMTLIWQRDGNANFTVSYTYMTIGVYTASIRAMNEVSDETYLWTIGVTRGPCQWPVVTLGALFPCLIESKCRNWDGMEVRQHYRSEHLYIYASPFINCSSTKIYHHTWTVTELDIETGAEIRNLTAEDVLDLQNEPTPLYKAGALTRLTFRKNTLTYGLYRFSLNVSMDQEIGIEHTDHAYIEIVKTPLIGLEAGGEFRVKGWGKNITFNALSETIDPDDVTDYSGMSMEHLIGNKTGYSCVWLCRRMNNETFPVYDENWNEIIPFQVLNETQYYYPMDTGGCFVDSYNSSGLFDIERSMKWDDGGCIFTHDLISAYENDDIEVKVVISRDTRSSNYTTRIRILEGDPPEISLKNCLANCKEKVNYAAKYAVQAEVTNGRAGVLYEHTWDLYELDYIPLTPNPLQAHQFGHLLETREKHLLMSCPEMGLENIVDADSYAAAYQTYGRYLDFCRHVSTGINRQAITIEPGLFSAEDATRTFFFHIIVRRPNSRVYGETYKAFFINEPPLPGECFVDPPNGTALVTKFKVYCPVDFEDQHKPYTYEIKLAGSKARNNDPETITNWNFFHKGASPTSLTGSIMAAGDPQYGDLLWIRVRCFDSIGSWTDVFINVTVAPPPDELVLAESDGLTSGNAEGLFADPERAIALCSALSKSMDTLPVNCTECPHGLIRQEVIDTTIDDKLDDEELEDLISQTIYECTHAFDTCVSETNLRRMKTKEACAKGMADQVPSSPDECAAKFDSFAVMSKNPDDVSTESAASMQNNMKNGLKNAEQAGADPGAIEGMAASVTDTAGKSSEAMAKAQREEAEEEAGLSSNNEAVAEVRRRRRRRSTTSGSSSDTQLAMLELVSQIGGMVGNSKAAGESPSQFLTDALNLAVNKAWGDKAGKYTTTISLLRN